MLEDLAVHNFAIIEKLQVRFTAGLNVLTGETGAGKSILIGALGLLLGDRADTSIVRAGAEEAAVSGVIGIGGSTEAAAWLAARGIEAEEGAVILRRVLKATGRGASFIQSTPVTRADLAEFSSMLFDVHGQHEHQSLLDLEQHRRLLDRHGGTENLAGRLHELCLALALEESPGIEDDPGQLGMREHGQPCDRGVGQEVGILGFENAVTAAGPGIGFKGTTAGGTRGRASKTGRSQAEPGNEGTGSAASCSTTASSHFRVLRTKGACPLLAMWGSRVVERVCGSNRRGSTAGKGPGRTAAACGSSCRTRAATAGTQRTAAACGSSRRGSNRGCWRSACISALGPGS